MTETKQMKNTAEIHIAKNDKIQQEITLRDGYLKRLTVLSGTQEKIHGGTLRVRLYEENKQIKEWKMDISEIVDYTYYEFDLLKEIYLYPDKKYYFEIINESLENESVVFASTQGSSEEIICYQMTFVDMKKVSRMRLIIFVLLIILGGIISKYIDFLHFSKKTACMVAFVSILCMLISSFDLFERINKEVCVAKYDTSLFVDLMPQEEIESNIDVGLTGFDTIYLYLQGEHISDIRIQVIDIESERVVFNQEYYEQDIVFHQEADSFAISVKNDERFHSGKYNIKIQNVGDSVVGIGMADEQEHSLSLGIYKNTCIATKMALIVYLCMITYFLFIYILNKSGKLSFENYFLVSATILSSVFLMIMPVWNAPDAVHHYAAIYRFSNIAMGYPKEQEWFARVEDSEYYLRKNNFSRIPNMHNYLEMFGDFHVEVKNDEMEDSSFHTQRHDSLVHYSILNYWPSVIGITLGRMLHMSAALCIYLARLFFMIFYILAGYYAIRTTPIGKSVFSIIMLVPMALMLSNAFSYDAMVLVIVFNFLGSLFSLCEKYCSKMLVQTCFFSFYLGAIKGGGMLILLPLVLIAYNKKEKKQSVKRMGIIIGMGLLSALIFNIILQWGNSYFQFGSEYGERLSVSYALENPFKYLKMMITTYLNYCDHLWLNMLGGDMMMMDTVIPFVIVVSILFILVMYSLLEKDTYRMKVTSIKIIKLMLLVYIVITPMMLLSWTSKGSDYIEGLQGRYYLPVLVLGIFAVTKSKLHEAITEKIGEIDVLRLRNKCMILWGFLLWISVYYLERIYFTR